MPADSAARASTGAFFCAAHQPVRIFSVTGTFSGVQAATTASTIFNASGLVLHQGRTGPGVAHLLGRAAHVDVDDLRPALEVVARRLGHLLRVDAGDLHRDGAGSPVWSARREVFSEVHRWRWLVTISLTA